jgi:hypothetical protein
MKEMMVSNMVDGLHIHTQNKAMKSLAIALSEEGVGPGERWWGDLINVQYKSICNCHNDSPHTTNIA